MGNMPKNPFVGAHLVPMTMFFTPTLKKRGTPSLRIKMKMMKRKRRDERANSRSTSLIAFSLLASLLFIDGNETLFFQYQLPVLREHVGNEEAGGLFAALPS